MTKEEAITNLYMISIAFVDPVTREQRKLINVTFEMAIQALSQEPILDKIRAEISDLDDAEYEFEGYYKAVNDAVQIIDKYKAESGVK